MKEQFIVFIIRWLSNSFGLWVAVRLLGSGVPAEQIDGHMGIFLLAGLVFSVLNLGCLYSSLTGLWYGLPLSSHQA